jgi:hypothetical protein
MRAITLLAATILAVSAMAATPGRVVLRRTHGIITLTPPAAVLQKANVRKHLESGLTTTFAVEAGEGKARIEIRYDLWDERWLITTVDVNGREHDEAVPSYARLVSWWSALALPVSRAEGTRMRIRMSVLPFSERERSDTEEWVTRTVGLARGGSEAPVAEGSVPGMGVLDAAIATSIQRRVVERFEWHADILPDRP